ncbi:MAG: hypothetical protein QME35_07080 [Thermoanaerobacteraceae bacterium]|nr:hypothetical protein [Thermoanaerobacteraceae bacterium]
MSVRLHKYDGCGVKIDRNTNAAINILHEGLKQIV